MTYLMLMIAILSEVAATSALKASEGFTKPLPSILVVIGYSVAFYFLSRVMQVMPAGIVYAIWSGLGIVLISIAAFLLYGQRLDPAALAGLSLIILGVAVIHLLSNSLPR